MKLHHLGGIISKTKIVYVFHTLEYMNLGDVSHLLNLNEGVYVYQSGYAGMDFKNNTPLLGYAVVYVTERCLGRTVSHGTANP